MEHFEPIPSHTVTDLRQSSQSNGFHKLDLPATLTADEVYPSQGLNVPLPVYPCPYQALASRHSIASDHQALSEFPAFYCTNNPQMKASDSSMSPHAQPGYSDSVLYEFDSQGLNFGGQCTSWELNTPGQVLVTKMLPREGIMAQTTGAANNCLQQKSLVAWRF